MLLDSRILAPASGIFYLVALIILITVYSITQKGYKCINLAALISSTVTAWSRQPHVGNAAP